MKKQIGTDMNGRPVFDGDRVLSFNLTPIKEYGPGVPSILKLRGERIYVYRENDNTSTACVPDDVRFGVLKTAR